MANNLQNSQLEARTPYESVSEQSKDSNSCLRFYFPGSGVSVLLQPHMLKRRRTRQRERWMIFTRHLPSPTSDFSLTATDQACSMTLA
ncbi:hypothetical protein L596_021475 [Steinernema carpocapsae]|uniref:Uncharacterized protein n=1 Tax=Steinernema carpocapsae TaxID=34508 RepID=A0A4U5MIU7_STECR|nr:hypothetical protein L596_021475 [Steinernema carpocapsae]